MATYEDKIQALEAQSEERAQQAAMATLEKAVAETVRSAEIVPFPQGGGALDLASLNYQQIKLSFDADQGLLRADMRHPDRPCYTPLLLEEIADLQQRLAKAEGLIMVDRPMPVRYLVWGTERPGAWNLGGDLELFTQLIRSRDREMLRAYAHRCIDVLYANHTAMDLPIQTVALIEGDTLGGGFEAMLSDDIVIASRDAQFGLPEILFNMFPGMGAFSFLSRKLGTAKAEELIYSGKLYTAEEMKELGLVDIVCEPGETEQALKTYLRRFDRRHSIRGVLREVRETCAPVTKEEMLKITDMWVDAAMNLTPMDLRKMEKLVAGQRKLADFQMAS
ncbi:MAG: crotonase/enoyl-CoA hydratase family protein [Geminicoccaceae bacterium]